MALLCVPISALSLHIHRLPLWLLVLMGCVCFWRVQIYRERWGFPAGALRLVLVIVSLLAVVSYYRQWYALEPMVSLLIIAFLLKIVEVHSSRDVIVLVFVGFFVTASALLFTQGIVISLAASVVLCLLLACLLNLHTQVTPLFSRRALHLIAVLLLQAIPVMLLLLFVFPRMGTLWSVPLQTSQAYTGVSDSLSPGDFSQLSRSRQLAFRVSFDQQKIPAPSERYWRGLVLTDFDGRSWSRSKTANKRPAQQTQTQFIANDDRFFRYEIVLEATAQPWLYAMPLASVDKPGVVRTATDELWLPELVSQRLSYQVTSLPDYTVVESAESLRQALLLPQGYNPKTLAMARQWRHEAYSQAAYVERVLAFYHQSFHYTLSPPLLGRDSVDEFLFNTQRGFCEHFASSFVTLMRAGGVPARVVVGYQGGQWNAADDYLIVRQSDAHAWAEVWYSATGWVRVDPTAAVAPNRVELSLADSLSAQDQALLRGSTFDIFTWSKHLALRWDSLNYRWQRWVLQYDQQRQSVLLQRVLGQVTPWRLALLLLVPVVILFALFAWWLLGYKRRRQSRESVLFRQLCKRLARRGICQLPGETLGQLCQRAATALPEKQFELGIIANLLNALFYSDEQAYQYYAYRRLRGLIKHI
ncbi:MAG: DUF3488 and transglutaminase-like domain-containing protein [Cellvibrionaceae bacterium]|nr:DUF3488 and transglutaminase-like domain-containing protein [Cellvibrionaceae bacterium]